MKGNVQVLEIDKCVVSRLWFTTFNALSREIHHLTDNYTRDEILELISIIQDETSSQIDYKDRLIIWKILDLLGVNSLAEKPDRIEFVLALKFIADNIPQEVEEELLNLFKNVCDSKSVKTNVEKISDESLNFLDETLEKYPSIACRLIKSLLCVWSSFFYQNDAELQNLYVKNLKKLLGDVSKDEIVEKIQSQNGSGFRKINFTGDKDSDGILLSILSKLELTETENEQLLNWLFPALFNHVENRDVALALYARRSNEYLNEWISITEKKLFRLQIPDTIENSWGISNAIFNFHHNSVDIIPRELAYRTIKLGRHWLMDILDIFYALSASGNHENISTLLSASILNGFWPVVLFAVLHNLLGASESFFGGDEEVSLSLSRGLRSFLSKSSEFFNCDDEMWKEIKCTIENQLDIVDWVLRNRNKNSDKEFKKELTIKHIFPILMSHGVLATLKDSTNFHEGNFKDILNLLKNSEESATAFKAYYAMLSALRAILLSNSYFAQTRSIAENLTEMKNILENLFPLDIRLEVVENIFSMLFLRHEDFSNANNNSEESDRDTEDSDGEKEEEKQIRETDFRRFQSGFLCNKYILRDILHYLKLIVRNTPKSESLDFDLKQRLRTVSEALADAAWRLELSTSSEFVVKIGSGCSEGAENREGFNFSEILLARRPNASKVLKNKSIFYQQNDSSSSEDYYSKSEIDISSDAGSTENTNSYTGSRKKSWKKNVAEKSTQFNANYSFITNFMLSSKETFVIHCIWKCDFDKAQQVIKNFNASDSQLDGEVRFSKAMSQFRKKIEDNMEVLDPAATPNENQKISTLQNIRQVVQEGIQTSRVTGQLETFLASNKATLRLISPEETNTNEIQTLAILDLALTMGNSRSYSLNACEVAKKYLKSCKIIEKTTYSVFFSRICKLFYEIKADVSLPDILCDATVPLSIQKLNDKNEFWNEVENVVKIFFKARFKNEKCGGEIKTENDMLIQTEEALANLTALCSGEAYLAKIFAYLNILRNILPRNLEDNLDSTNTFGMLELPVHLYLGHQFFELKIEPEKLEMVAKKLGVNLVHSILVNCCPRFPFYDKIEKIGIGNEPGYIVLNEDSAIANEFDMEKPGECVAKILNELLDLIEGKIYPDKSTLKYIDLQNLSKITEVQEILRKTSALRDIDLCELSAGNETTTFFLNLWNILFLHSMLTVWSNNPPSNRLQHVVSAMNIVYKVGDLGLVSLATLRSKLLGNLAWDLDFFKQFEDLNDIAWLDLDLDQDPRVIFAMANEFFGTPAIRVYDPKDLDDALNGAIQDYIAFYNLIEAGKENKEEIDVCWLPEAVCRYQDFLLENASLSRQKNLDESFTLRKFINTSEMNNIEFKYKTLTYNLEVRINYYENKSPMQNIPAVRRFFNNSSKTKRKLDENLIQYFEGHCWILAYLVLRIHERSLNPSIKAFGNIERCFCLENLLRSSWTETLKNTFEDNQALVGMHENVSHKEIWAYFECLIKKERWKRCIDVINSLPDNIALKDNEISSLKDKILSILISAQEFECDQVLGFLRQIKNINVLVQAVLSNVKSWPVDICEVALTYILNHSERKKLPYNSQIQINSALSRVKAFHKMLPHFENNPETKSLTWYGIASATNKTDSSEMVKSLIEANKFELCLEWLMFHTFSTEIQSLVTKDLLIGLLHNNQQDFEPATKLLQALPMNRSFKLCNGVLKKLENVSALKFINEYLLDRCKTSETVKYHKISISIEILSRLESRERSAFIHLLKHPLLMLEQLLMNGKFEVLSKILNAVKEILPKASISLEDIDKIIRYYARKSLEFRIAIQRDGMESKTKDSSSSSLSTDIENTVFVMPSKVPTKEEWVPNDKSRVCSCCKSVVFSMFNRRHHCRRCGRVVCGVCSQQRMRVPTYPDSVHVRVCDDCKRQSMFRTPQNYGAPSTPSSEIFDYWSLTTDKTHNQTVKDEFSYEHAPSISLCLAILNLHSDHKAYASFLLDRCDEIKQYLRPVSSGRANPEVDHKLIVRMIRSLSVAAKVKCAQLSLNAGLDNCDRMLSHVDLIATLVQSDCSALIPFEKLDEHTLPRLRVLLTEKEQWILALDVSTKAGLDRQGVWAAWGKAYLKVGCYDQAREKFAHCLEKVSTNGFEDWIFLPSSYQAETPSPKKNFGREKTRPTKNPPLLNEILQIIESSNFNRQSRRIFSSKSFTAYDISLTLNNLKAISQGRYQDVERASDNAYYQESLHYLLSYGSHSSILEFFIKHDNYEECLSHVLDNKIDPETFFNSVYLPSLKNGCIDTLHEVLRSKDASLISWRNYLVFTCHSLESKKYFHTLYQLQIFTKDYIRAAMSCIRFYINGATNYTDLCSRSKFLYQAQKHLETELQAQSFGPKRKKATGSQHSAQNSFTLELELSDIDRHINSISSQMEIAKFLRNNEQEGRDVAKFLNELYNMENETPKAQELPTLFGTQFQKTQLAVLAILCGRNVEEGFGIAFRIIQDYNLRSEKVYSLAGHILASEEKISSVEQLVKCCRSSGAPDTNALSDRVLAHCVKLVLNSSHQKPETSSASKDKVDSLIKLITDLELKISMCIESRQLKAAYLLAVRHSRAQDVRKIFKEADRLEQNAIKAICAKWLQQTKKS